jgi:hypothetical protein
MGYSLAVKQVGQGTRALRHAPGSKALGLAQRQSHGELLASPSHVAHAQPALSNVQRIARVERLEQIHGLEQGRRRGQHAQLAPDDGQCPQVTNLAGPQVAYTGERSVGAGQVTLPHQLTGHRIKVLDLFVVETRLRTLRRE